MLRGTQKSQDRTLLLIGCAVLVCVVVAVLAVMYNPFNKRSADLISIAIETPYVGQGVETGTAVVLHGVEVGTVTNATLLPDGNVRLATDLQKQPIEGLTDTLNIDFRPINFFGVPGVNIIPTPGGQPVRDGAEIRLVPKGNFTLSELLSQLGDVTSAAITPQLISTLDRVTRYTDAFNPLFETLLMVTTALADVQRVPTAQLVSAAADIATPVGPFLNQVINIPARLGDFSYYPTHGDPRGIYPQEQPQSEPGGEGSISVAAAAQPKLTAPYREYSFVRNSYLEDKEFFEDVQSRGLEIASGGLFASVGKLASSHVDELLPLVQGITSVTDTVPALLRPADLAYTLAEARTRLENLYRGNGQQRALQVRILLDSLPGVAAPLGVQSATAQDVQECRPGDAGTPGAGLPAEVHSPPSTSAVPAAAGVGPRCGGAG